MATKYLIGVDIGTTGAKTTIFTLDGLPIANAYYEYSCEYPKPLWVEQDAKMLVDAAINTIAAAVSKSKINKNELRSIGFSTQRSCALFMNESGHPLKMISWQDSRSGDIVKKIEAVVSPSDFYRKTGLPSGSTWILPKMLWVKENDVALWRQTTHVVQLHDYVLREFGADGYYTPETDAGMTCLWDVDHHQWNDEFLRAFQIDAATLPQVRPAGFPVGKISQKIADMTGLPYDMPLCVGIGDQSAAGIGAGIIHDGDVSVSMGTGGMLIRCVDKPMRDPNGAFMVTNHGIPEKWQWEGLQKGSAGTYRWFRDEIASLENALAKENNENIYDILGRMAETVPAGSNGLLMLPFFASAGTPRWNTQASGALIGLTFAHNKATMARAFMEGVTLEHRDMMESLKKSGLAASAIHIIGGPTKSVLWNRIQASVYHMPVQTLRHSDASVIGAAIIGAVGAGIFSNIEEGVNSMVQTKEVFEPDTQDAAVYDELYAAYCEAYDGLSKKTYPLLNRISHASSTPE